VNRNEISPKNACVVMAVSVFTSSNNALNLRPTEVFGYWAERRGLEVCDELVMGKEKRAGWLGKPMGEMVHLVRSFSKNQTITINGEPVGEILRIDGKDALFLVKEK